jgi:hypothetical protein
MEVKPHSEGLSTYTTQWVYLEHVILQYWIFSDPACFLWIWNVINKPRNIKEWTSLRCHRQENVKQSIACGTTLKKTICYAHTAVLANIFYKIWKLLSTNLTLVILCAFLTINHIHQQRHIRRLELNVLLSCASVAIYDSLLWNTVHARTREHTHTHTRFMMMNIHAVALQWHHIIYAKWRYHPNNLQKFSASIMLLLTCQTTQWRLKTSLIWYCINCSYSPHDMA